MVYHHYTNNKLRFGILHLTKFPYPITIFYPNIPSKVSPNTTQSITSTLYSTYITPQPTKLTTLNFSNFQQQQFLFFSFVMESSASNSTTPPNNNHHHHHPRFKPSQPISDRIVRALRHHLRLLHRSGSTFFILGATGNVYTVSLSSTPSCTCPDRTTPCKHILFVLIRVLGVSLDDVCLRRRTLRPCQVQRLLGMPTLPEAVAGGTLRQRFHELFFDGGEGGSGNKGSVEMEEGACCPVCLEEMGKKDKLVACGTCRNPIHEECLIRWKRSRGRRSASCVICRARWRDRNEQDKYINLSAYVSDDDMTHPDGSLCSG